MSSGNTNMRILELDLHFILLQGIVNCNLRSKVTYEVLSEKFYGNFTKILQYSKILDESVYVLYMSAYENCCCC